MRQSIVFFIFISLICNAHAGTFCLVSNGKVVGSIIIPAKPSKAEEFAAEELQMYIEKISGAKLNIISTDRPENLPAIIVGHHVLAKDIIAEMDKRFPTNKDRIAVVAKWNRLYLTGCSEDAILWATWDWLESLGIRWLLPTEKGEYVPKFASILIGDIEKYDAPKMAFRGPNYAVSEAWCKMNGRPSCLYQSEHGIPASTLFSYRMRLNNNCAFDAKDMWISIGSGHSYMYFLPVVRYFKSHPDWYNLVNQKRMNSTGWQICFTNHDAAKEFAKNMCGSIKACLKQGVPIEQMKIFVSPNDGRAKCECQNCIKLIEKDGGSASLVLNFTNLVADEIHKIYPQAKIVYYVYDNYGRVPEYVKPAKGVYPEIVFWTSNQGTAANHAHPMFSDFNKKYQEAFNWFAKNSEGVFAHEYYGHYNWFTPYPQMTQMSCDIKKLTEYKNFVGLYSESHLHWGTQAFNFYLQPKLMWNPNLNVDDLLADYCQKAYGPAGELILKFYKTLQNKMDGVPYICGYNVEIPELLTENVIAKCNKYIDLSEKMLDCMDASTRWRAKLLIESWRNSVIFARANALYIGNPISGDREKILDYCNQVQTFAQSELGKFAYEYPVVDIGLKNITGALRVDLSNLQHGTTVYNDYFMYGGAIKFFAQITGWQKGMWGYSLAPNSVGTIKLPVKCQNDFKIDNAKVKFNVDGDTAGWSAELTAVDGSGKTWLLAKGVKSICENVNISQNILKNGNFILCLKTVNNSDNQNALLVGMHLEIKVLTPSK